MRGPRYESDPAFADSAYTVRGYRGVAWYVLGWEIGWEIESDDGDVQHEQTGRVVAVMVGDDRHHVFDVEDLTRLAPDDYCGECGQVGCAHDGR